MKKLDMIFVVIFSAITIIAASPKSDMFKVRYFWGAGKIPFSNDVSIEGRTGKIISWGNSAEGKFGRKCTEGILPSTIVDTLKKYITNKNLMKRSEVKNEDGRICEGSEWVEIMVGQDSTRHYKPCKQKWDATDSIQSSYIDSISDYLAKRILIYGHECKTKNQP